MRVSNKRAAGTLQIATAWGWKASGKLHRGWKGQGAIPDCGVVLGDDLKVEGRDCLNGELIAMEEGTVF
jgi:hypothetical protein